MDLSPALQAMSESMKKASASLKGLTFVMSKWKRPELKPGDLVRTTDRVVSWNNWAIPAGMVGKFVGYDRDSHKAVVRFGDILFNVTAEVRLGVNAEAVDVVTAIGSLEGRT